MEDIIDGATNLNINDSHQKNRVEVSNTKKPLFFYVNLAKVIKSFRCSLSKIALFIHCFGCNKLRMVPMHSCSEDTQITDNTCIRPNFGAKTKTFSLELTGVLRGRRVDIYEREDIRTDQNKSKRGGEMKSKLEGKDGNDSVMDQCFVKQVKGV
ncbi:hypothetical protein MKW98_006723 [Papaver atlanticum]|uniref:Uncharacterized protein n=1 Tax=Papaver atlanticum TaxID=357466 RepID=A0AAD4T0P2_9MAGN|nr:hypothetical protein MKW98_006723 [Papaver atlanticum]